MKVELFKQKFNIAQSAHQAHLVYKVYVPKNVCEIEVQFHYDPIVESEEEMIRKALAREGLSEYVIQENTTVNNLLTVSINDPQNFRGARHVSSKNQIIQIGNQKASVGFIAGTINEGVWEFTISCHGVFSEKMTGQITINSFSEIDGTKKQEAIPLKDIQLDQIQKNRSHNSIHEVYSWRRLELHSHTIHSDALQTTEELLKQAQNEKIDWLAITDHNTITALIEAENHNNFNQSLKLLNGIEYTTFYGHFLVHGPRDKITMDWTKISKNNLSYYLQKLKEKDVYITIAHPFDGGNPFCTGCRFEYVLENLKYVDAVEVWNGTNPHQSLSNEDAFYRWTQLLKQGYEIAASSGRDWHRIYPNEEAAYTNILVPHAEKEEDILNALNIGRTYISIRPHIEFNVNEIHILGDRVEDKTGELQLSISLSQLESGDIVRIFSQSELLKEKAFTDEQEWKEEIQLHNDGYSLLRIEVLNKENERIAFTNPIYIHRKKEKG